MTKAPPPPPPDDFDDDEGPEIVKRFLYVNRRAPYGTIYALEALGVVLIGDVSVAFVDDGVYQLKKDQDTAGVEMKNFSPTYSALEMYDVEKLYVERESLDKRGLSAEDLVVPVEVMGSDELGALMERQDVVLSF